MEEAVHRYAVHLFPSRRCEFVQLDGGSHALRRVTLPSEKDAGRVDTLVGGNSPKGQRGGTLSEARFCDPRGVAVASTVGPQATFLLCDVTLAAQGMVYVSDATQLYRVDEVTGNVVVIAGSATSGFQDGDLGT